MRTIGSWALATALAWMAVASHVLSVEANEVGARVETGTEERAAANLPAIRYRAASMPVDARIDMDKRIGATVERVNRRAVEQGSTTMTARFAAEFSVPSETILDVKAEHGWSWGEVMIAYTLLANSPKGVAPRDLAALRGEGLGWSAIAYGLQFRMEGFEDAIKAQGRVAMGLSRTDGKAEVIRR